MKNITSLSTPKNKQILLLFVSLFIDLKQINIKPIFTYSTKIFTVLLSLLCFSTVTLAQIGPGIAPITVVPTEGFAIDGKLHANHVNPSRMDWLPGTGAGVLTSAGLPVDGTTTFHLTDLYSPLDNTFNGGKVNSNPNNLKWKTAIANDKTNMQNALIHFATDPATGHIWVIFAADRLSNNGNGYIDFEFLQSPLTKTSGALPTAGGFSASGPDGGRTVGDFLLTVYFENGVSSFDIQRWQPVGSGYDFVSYYSSIPSGTVSVYAAGNIIDLTTPPLPYDAFGGLIYPQNTFIEAAVDLTTVLKAISSCNKFVAKTIFIKSKVSNSPSANIDDFFDPLQVNMNLSDADARDDDEKCSEGVAGTTFTLDGKSRANSATYQWSVVSHMPPTGTAPTFINSTDPNTDVKIYGTSATLKLTVTTTNPNDPDTVCPAEDTVVLTVKPAPICSIDGADTVCPSSSSNSYSAPDPAPASTTYLWSISGNGLIAGSTTSQTVFVTAGSGCETSFTLSLTVTGENECSTTCIKTITVDDQTAPVISFIPLDVTVSCASEVPAFNDPAVTATDNCVGALTVSHADVVTPGSCTNRYSIARTYTVTDICGNASSQTQTITVDDQTAPVISFIPLDVTVSCASEAPAFNDPAVTATDNCVGALTVSHADVVTPGSCTNRYSIARTYTVTDICGNASSQTQTITVDDQTAPVISFIPLDVTVSCAAEVPAFNDPAVSATDNCVGALTVSHADVVTPGSCTNRYSIARTYTVTDICGNASSQTQTITVDDQTAPVISFIPLDVTVSCASEVPAFNDPAVSATDNCMGALTVSHADVVTPGSCTNRYSIARTYTVTDICGNASSQTQTITVDDQTAPVISFIPLDVTVSCASEVPAFNDPAVTATDNCVGALTVSHADVVTPGSCTNRYSIARTYTVTDICGNASSQTQTITVDDQTAPVISFIPLDVTVSCASEVPAFNDPAVSATDNCVGALTVTHADVVTPGSCTNRYSIARTYTVTDICGNASSQTQTITVDDQTAPVISFIPLDVTVRCASEVPAFNDPAVSATDNCVGALTVSHADVVTPGSCTNRYSIARTYTVTDICGNASSQTQTITVDDQTAPVISFIPLDVTVSCASEVPAFNDPAVSATDNCVGALTVSHADVVTPGSCTNRYSIARTYTVTDICGNASSQTQTITVDDQTAPVISFIPLDVTVSCASEVPAFNDPAVTATDNCVGALTVSHADVVTPGSCTNRYSIARTYTVTDICGNASSQTQTITVDDQTAPVITALPAVSTINCPATPVFAVATATDACGSVFTLTSADVTTSGACAGSYSVTRTWTATDACGNKSTASQTINVKDVTAPLIAALPAVSTINCPATPVFAVATATDACGSVFTLTSADVTTPGACAGSYSVTRTWTATDACGNKSTASQTINVKDVTAPLIAALPAVSTINCPATPVFAVATATDACGSVFTLTSADVTTPGACAGSYSVTRTWTATDACGNKSTASQTINVKDVTAPLIAALPAVSTINCPATPVFAVATATDACGSVFTLTSADVTTPGACAGSYSVTRTWTATDACGNKSTASQTIYVKDVTAPLIAALPAVSTINCPATPVFAVATATDACGSVFTLTSADVTTSGACAGSYSVTRTWTATDACGNKSTASQTINVKDVTAPVIAALPAVSNINCPATPVFAVATATDACGSVFTLTSADVTTPGACAGSYSVTRTWTATDACGNKSTASQTINVKDVTAPVIAALPAVSNINCPATPVFAVATATDACGSVFTLTSADVTTPGACAGSYSVTRTWTATDACGNKSTASQTINVKDVTAPVIAVLPAVSNINCPATPVFAVATATDACGSVFTLTSADVTTPGACAGSYSVTRTWTATDACGNKSTASQTIYVKDVTAPVIAALPAVSTINCPATPVFAVATATDACGSVFTLTSADVTTPGACAGSYSVTRTWTATDACGNKSTASQTINVKDVTAPVIAALPAVSNINCPATPVFAVATATDACGSVFTLTSADVTTPGACAGSYSVTRTWTATDACGNKSTASQTINVKDVTAPVIAALPAVSNINCPATPVFAVATATDACGSVFTLTSADVTTPGACAGSYSVTRTWTATDACGNKSTASQTINVKDVTAPVIAVLPAVSNINCPATPVFAVATATDACGSVFTLTSADVTTPGACAGSYSVTRTWTATDACGNKSTASQTINVKDVTAPVIAALPAVSTINCPATPVFAVATATDACGSVFTLTSADVTTPGACAGSYSVTRTWTATDACGNKSTASQTINVKDVTAPVIAALPAVSNINCPATPVFAVATATDACGSVFTLTSADVTTPGACAGSYSVTRTWTATDACGNKSTASQTINVKDVTAPVIAALPAVSNINCPATPVFAVATATDACGSVFTLTSADVTTPGACAGSYSVTRTWTATDACGNKSTASQTINVKDVTAPVIAALPAVSNINCPATPVFAVATATDACGSVFTLTSADVTTPGACAGSYSVTRTWTATDACGNKSTASQTINVKDVTAPVIAALPAVSNINCPATPVFAVATATDACGSVFTLTSADVTTPGACAGSYSVTRTWTATDACGNKSTASQTINVKDVTAPVIAALPAVSTINCPATPVFAVATATDACGSVFTLTSADVTTPGACAGSYSVTRTWTATDACGNKSTASQTINVKDVTAPVIAALPAVSNINCPATPVFAVATATDACGSVFTLTSADVTTPGACAGSYSVTRTWTATDACGNKSTASQTINVKDVTAPVIAALPAVSNINCPATPVFAVATATDACGSVFTLTSADVTTSGACAGSYSVTRTWTATDACGNKSTASQTINVKDVTAPVIAALPAVSTINCPATPVFAVATATDVCQSAFTLTSADVTTQGACAGSYSVTRTWTATDTCGNTATASQTINVQDITAPVIASLPEPSTINCPATPAFAVATATDACQSAFTLTSADVTTQGECAGSYSVTRTWTATDTCGNTATASQTINVQDITAPVIASLPEPSTINCPATPAFAVATATDACQSAFTLTSADVTTQGECAGSYSVTRTWTATDSCGNTSTASQTINVVDNTAPDIIGDFDEVLNVNCDAIPPVPQLQFTDACSSEITVEYPVSPDVLVEQTNQEGNITGYVIIREWNVSDSCENFHIFTQTINVKIEDYLIQARQEACNGDSAPINLMTLVPQIYVDSENGTWVDVNNSGGLHGNNDGVFSPFGIPLGDYIIEYQIKDPDCPRKVQITLSVNDDCIVLACGTITVHNAFSPNNDSQNLNEVFFIENIDDFICYPSNRVEIYNRWGILVYDVNGYDNNTKAFRGISEGRSTVNQANELPVGTYFYILEYTTTEGKTLKKDGFLYLSR